MWLRCCAVALLSVALLTCSASAQTAKPSTEAGLSGQAFKDQLKKAIQAQQKG